MTVPAARQTCEQAVLHVHGENAGTGARTWELCHQSSLDTCRLLNCLGFLRKIALIQFSVRKGGSQQLHAFTHYLQFKKQQGSGQSALQAEHCNELAAPLHR